MYHILYNMKIKTSLGGQRMIQIYCSHCGTHYIENEGMIYLDIHENELGQDIVSFECPNCKKIAESKRLG